MRILIGIGGGVAVGLLFVIQALGMAHWCPLGLFAILHFPSKILVLALSLGSVDTETALSPFAVVVQWTFLGTLVGVVLHLKQRSKNPPHETESSQDRGLPTNPKTITSIVRVVCILVGLLFLFSLLFGAWVLFTPHR